MTPVGSSWRAQISPGGVLAAPADLEVPWLFSMDPMTYVERGDADDDKLRRADLDGLASVIAGYVTSGRPGVALMFIYNVWPARQRPFWEFIDELSGRIKATAHKYSVAHRGGARNLVGLLCSPSLAVSGWLPAGLRAER